MPPSQILKATTFEFRFRYLLHALIMVLGFWAPWTMIHTSQQYVVTSNTRVWSILAATINGWMGDNSALTAFNLLLILGIVLTTLAALLRTWGSAYITAPIVQSSELHTASDASGILQDGPYRHLRNPLYLGTFLHYLGVSLLMPQSGAIFAIVAVGLLQFRLIAAEEHFLHATLGPRYDAYRAKVPSLLPTLRPAVPATGIPAHWPQAFLGEFYMWGVAITFALFGWRYNSNLLLQGVLISFGLSLIFRVFLPTPKGANTKNTDEKHQEQSRNREL